MFLHAFSPKKVWSEAEMVIILVGRWLLFWVVVILVGRWLLFWVVVILVGRWLLFWVVVILVGSRDGSNCFCSVTQRVLGSFQPGAVVVQCGGDALALDKLGGACLTIEGYSKALEHILALGLPTLMLGGGEELKKIIINFLFYVTCVIRNKFIIIIIINIVC